MRCSAVTRDTWPSDEQDLLGSDVDASWGDDPDTRRSRYGYVIYLGGAPICWRSKLHASVALSTAEAEYIAACECAKQAQ